MAASALLKYFKEINHVFNKYYWHARSHPVAILINVKYSDRLCELNRIERVWWNW